MSMPDSTSEVLEGLCRARGGQPPYLAAHHREAALRVQRLFSRARLQPSVTQSFSHQPRSATARNTAADIPEMAAQARKQLNAYWAALPNDCAGVVIDVCGFEKGLQDIEREKGWPRRSAKLVLRIGLEQLALSMGLAESAQGGDTRRDRTWRPREARPDVFG